LRDAAEAAWTRKAYVIAVARRRGARRASDRLRPMLRLAAALIVTLAAAAARNLGGPPAYRLPQTTENERSARRRRGAARSLRDDAMVAIAFSR
jgi:hypothetical protein